jgi:hypothetical protein
VRGGGGLGGDRKKGQVGSRGRRRSRRGRCGDGSGGDTESWTPRTTVERPLIRLDGRDDGGRIGECGSRRRPRSNGCYCWGWNRERRRHCDADEEAEAWLWGDAEDTIRSAIGRRQRGIRRRREVGHDVEGAEWMRCGTERKADTAGEADARRKTHQVFCLTSILFRSRDFSKCVSLFSACMLVCFHHE